MLCYFGSLWMIYWFNGQWCVGVGLDVCSGQQFNCNLGFYVLKFVIGNLMVEYIVIEDELLFCFNVDNVVNKFYVDLFYMGYYVLGKGCIVVFIGIYKF